MTIARTATPAEGLDSGRPGRPGPGSTMIVPALDGFRGMAALSVLLYHVMLGAGLPKLDEGPVRSILMSGYMGVDFFFVISGFVLFLPTVVNGGRFGNVRAYAIRRASRIIPAYWVVLVVLVATQPLLTTIRTDLPYQSGRGLLSMVLHMTFLQHSLGLALNIPEGFAVHGAVWTLTLEALFYVLLPLVAARYYRHPFLGFLLALTISLVWKQVITWPGTVDPHVFSLPRIILITQLPTYLAHFAAGMTAAYAFVRLRAVVTRPAHHLAAAAVAVLAASVMLLGMRAEGIRDLMAKGGFYDHFTRPVYVALAFAVLIPAVALAPAWTRAPFTNPVSRRLGDMSYGIYLWHLMLIGFALATLHFLPVASTRAFVRMLAFTLPLSLVAGWLSMKLVEQPAVRWARARSSALRRASGEGRPVDPPVYSRTV